MTEEYSAPAEAPIVDSRAVDEPATLQETRTPNELRTLMDQAIQMGSTEGLMQLFDSGVDINQEDWEGRTALMMLASRGGEGTTEAVELMLARGADVNCIYMYHGRKAFTALDAARQTGHGSIEAALLAHGAKTGAELTEA